MKKANSPLLGYNTNIRHAGYLFHIQTEDSGVDHPHIITHLFTEGTILASKKTGYEQYLEQEGWTETVKQMMKDQHKTMFVELRDGHHDEVAEKIIGKPLSHVTPSPAVRTEKTGGFRVQGTDSPRVTAVSPAQMDAKSAPIIDTSSSKGMSIFETPNVDGTFGESLISDKSLDEVILNYLAEDLD